MTWVESLASAVGAPESGLRLILGQMSGYPIFLFYRHFLRDKEAWIQHLFFALTGMFMAWWAVGDALMHSCITILLTYLVLRFMGGSLVSASIVFVFNFIYLFVGYYLKAGREYSIDWTMPQCVLCLRLIGLGMDVYDGIKPEAELGRDQLAAKLPECPSLLECLSHSFFIGGYFVGPQFSMRKYRDFITQNGSRKEDPVPFGLKRLAIGWAYMLTHLIGSGFVPESWVQTEDFANTNFLIRSFWFSLWVKIILCKYIACWLFAEGCCTVSGLAFNGVDEKTGQVLWNGMANVKLRVFEGAHRFQHYIDSFNINTNGWVMSYVYKRLRFLNNRMASQAGALLFLALWHGYHSGYFVCFFNEFLVMNFEKEFASMLLRSSKAQAFLQSPGGAIASKVIGWFYLFFWLPHCFLPFALLKRDKYWGPLKETYFLIYLFFGLWPLWKNLVKPLIVDKKVSEDSKKKE